jgi:hypothetical protein
MENMGFFGRDGTILAMGVVEDRTDPSKMGRVKVRWLGYHTEDKLKIPTADLPWCQCMMPVGGHSMSGVGESNPGIETGTWVIGFARDPDLMQEWIVLGTLPGKNVLPSQGEDEILKGDGITGSWGKSRDFEKIGFFDPTYQSGSVIQDQYLDELPFPPSRVSFQSNETGTITPTADYLEVHKNWGDGAYDRMKMYGDEILYGTAVSYSKARHETLALPKGNAKTFSQITHTDALYETYGTTRRLVGPPTDAKKFWTETGLSENMSNVNLGHVISTGYYDGDDITYPIISEVGIKHRTPYPRLEYCQKKSIEDLYGPSMLARIKSLYDDGVVGNKVGGKRKFSDVKATERVAIPVDDVNRLAKGGLKITTVTNTAPITVTTAGGSSYEPFVTGDVITISGVKGMQELNGRRFRAGAVTGDPKKGFTFVLQSADGSCIGGPGTFGEATDLIDYSKNVKVNPMATVEDSWDYPIGAPKFSVYEGGGVVLLDAHVSLETRAETREKWINIGHGMFVPGGKDAFGGDERTKEIMTHYWSEPTSANAAQYPFNHVYESESGHIMEYDDTPGAERINQMHRSGTYYEIDDSGNKTTKVTGDNHNLTIHDDYLYVKGKVLWTGDDEMMIRCNDQMTLGAKWNLRIVSDHNIDIHAKGDLNLRGHKVNIEAAGHSINMGAPKINMLAKGFASDTEPGTGYNAGGGEDEPFGGLIHIESKAFGSSSGRIVLKVPEGDPFADMAFGSDFAANQQLPGGAIVHEGGATVDLTDSPKSRNTIQARVNFAYKAADSVTAFTGGPYTNIEGDIGTWGALSDATHTHSKGMTGGSIKINKLGKPETNPFAGSTAPAINKNAEKIRDLHNEDVE